MPGPRSPLDEGAWIKGLKRNPDGSTEMVDVLQPMCWTWGVKEIREYIETQSARCNDNNVKDVATYLLRSLKGGRFNVSIVRLVKSSGAPTFLQKPYHRCDRVTLTDIFSALGWFISVSDCPKECFDSLEWYFRRLIIYTRLCRIIGETTAEWNNRQQRGALLPACTSIIFSVHHPPVFGVDDGSGVSGAHTVALSSSLPGGRDEKEDRRLARVADVQAYNPSFLQRFAANKTVEWDLGHCAETLNLLSHAMKDRWGYVFGTAINSRNEMFGIATWTPGMKFSDWKHTVKPPCDSCQWTILNNRLTFMDIGKFQVYGHLPPQYTIYEAWKQQIRCQKPKCGNSTLLERATVTCGDCPATWCCQKHKDDDARLKPSHPCFNPQHQPTQGIVTHTGHYGEPYVDHPEDTTATPRLPYPPEVGYQPHYQPQWAYLPQAAGSLSNASAGPSQPRYPSATHTNYAGYRYPL
ncbi:hypothetical protein BD410DRAFT_841877 [Rickenella mellea]|uniref:Uncharacterized protein n=1 Tax=Rickenella mellea TaxID=50990 RepID=A0A4Y7PYN6_9AGAM|nr:hypothetical protein BD410DRAFT_841877 [Rickenella mellea]